MASIKFSSASEVTEYLKRKATTAYYIPYPQSQKAAYSSTYTTFLGANAYKVPTVGATCLTTDDASYNFKQRPEKKAPGKNRWNPT
jgi:hypothetical protein